MRVIGCAALLAIAIAIAACHPVRVGYHLSVGALVPAGWSAPSDGRTLFAQRFCAAVPKSYGSCDHWLDLPSNLDPAQIETWSNPGPALDTDYLVVGLGGIFSDCLKDEVTTFKDGLEHLKSLHFKTEYWGGCADCSTSENGAEIVRRLHQLPAGARVIVFGHSKGAVDMIDAVSQDADIGDVVKAVIAVNSPVSGTRLADLIPKGLNDLSKKLGDVGTCHLGSGQGLDSLRRDARQHFWAIHPGLSTRTKFFSLVSVSTRERTSPVMRPLWDPMSHYSLDQDSQVIAEEGIVPGGMFLGRLQADHWAPAFPIELVQKPIVRHLFEDKNHFPRGALLEAAVRVFEETIR